MAIYPQTSFDATPKLALAGMLADARFKHTASRTAQDVMPFGVAAGSVSGQPDQCRLPIANTAVILDDAGAYTSGTFLTSINGVTISVAYDTNKATTMAAVATAIQALGFITTAVYAGGSNTITITAAANVHLSVGAITGPVGGMTITSTTYAMTDDLIGFVQRDTVEAGSSRVEVNDKAVATLANDVITTSDVVSGSINGVAITSVTYATSEAVTLQLVANSIMTVAGVANVAVDTALRTLTITMNPGLPLDSVALAVADNALGSVAPSFSYVYSAQGVGITSNDAKFAPTELPPILQQGSIWVQCEEAMTPASSVFVRIQATTSFAVRGRIRTDIDSGSAIAWTDAKIVGNSVLDPEGQRIVQVAINLP